MIRSRSSCVSQGACGMRRGSSAQSDKTSKDKDLPEPEIEGTMLRIDEARPTEEGGLEDMVCVVHLC